MNWRLHLTCNPLRSIPPVTYLYDSVGSKWKFMIVPGYRSFLSFIRALFVPTKRLLFVDLAIPIKWMSFQRFSLSLSLSSSTFCCSLYVFDICLTLLKIYVQQEHHVPESRLIFFEEKEKNNTQSAHRLNMIDFMILSVRASVRAFVCAFFVTFFLFRLTSFTDYGGKCSNCPVCVVVYFWHGMAWHGIHEWMNE